MGVDIVASLMASAIVVVFVCILCVFVTLERPGWFGFRVAFASWILMAFFFLEPSKW